MVRLKTVDELGVRELRRLARSLGCKLPPGYVRKARLIELVRKEGERYQMMDVG